MRHAFPAISRLVSLGVFIMMACRTPAPISRPDRDAAAAETARDAPIQEPERIEDADRDLADRGGLPDTGPDVHADPGSDPREAGAPETTTGDPAAAEDPGPDGSGTPIPRPCSITLRYRAPGAASSVTVPAEWNEWNHSAHPMTKTADGTFEVTIGPADVPPGEWGYKFLVDQTTWVFDPENPLRKYVGADYTENSRLIMPDCELPLLQVVSAQADWATRTVRVVVQAYTGVSGAPLDPASLHVELDHEPLAGDFFDPIAQRFVVERSGLSRGKYSFRFFVANAHGPAEVFVPVWLEQEPFSWRDAVLYFAMTDRFHDGDPANDQPASCLPAGNQANWLGGDFAGIRKKVESGYFDPLAVNAIWISPANANAAGCYPGSLGFQYTAYHGYFPVSLDQTDAHFGTLEDLRALVRAAHARGIRVLMDLAANHLHEESAIWSLHKDWFHTTPLICGEDDNWNQHPIDCWFQPYLPDLDFRNLDALNAVTDAAIRWAIEADLDGFRVDAVKHMIHDFGRTLRYKVAQRLETSGVSFYLVGETFDARDKIKEYISGVELHGQFDFPLYWAVLAAFARGEAGLCTVADEYETSRSFYGPDAIMSNFLGNHDVPRFLSHAAGQIPSSNPNDPAVKWLAWNDPPGLPASEDPFRRLTMAFAFLMTVPGVPLVYYGDEIGMPGAGDPDNRRMMTFDGLTAAQVALKDAVGRLGQFRQQHVAVRTGAFRRLACDSETLAYALTAPSDAVLVVFNRGVERTVSLDLSSVPGLPASGPLADALTAEPVTLSSGHADVPMPRLGVRVLAP